MGLEQYRRKRDFTKTPEPSGRAANEEPRRDGALSFVIQKHAARRLHYDFRLELGGVLKSWAIPKGPSLDPGEKRLAVHVEDHPLEYGGFEGVIPEGQYGGGTVLLWDRGRWIPEDPDPASAYEKGHLKFRLAGKKLTGGWALVRMGGRAAREGRDNWLLIKERDAAARPDSGDAITEERPESVETGRDMGAIARDADRVWDSAAGEITPPRPALAMRDIPHAAPGPLPRRIAPQLATAATKPPVGEDWLHEIKFDGYRILARLDSGAVRLFSRNGLDWTARFPEIAAALVALPARQALLDGEAVALDEDGRSSFSALQRALSEGKTAPLVYFAFDLLYLDGYDLRDAAIEARKDALAVLIEKGGEPNLRYSDHQEGRGGEFFEHACQFSLEGILSKRRGEPYRAGRSRSWLKVKCGTRQEFVIIGFTDPKGGRAGFGALVLGYYDDGGTLRYAGRAGTGYDEKILTALRRRLDRLVIDKRPVETLPKGSTTRDIHWVRPTLVAEFRFAEWTRDEVLRHAVFLGLREDKPAREVRRDPASSAASAASPPRRAKAATAIAGIRLTNPAKVLYPEDGITKSEIAAYYEQVARHALPHLTNRPLAILRCPEGRAAECFFQKHVSAGMPASIHHIEIAEEKRRETALYIADLAGLAALVQLGVLEIHPWGSTVRRIEHPDRLTFDLDPGEGVAWDAMIEAAFAVRTALDALGLQSFVKTTGGKGLHVVVPIAPRLAWPEAKAFAKAVAEALVAAAPERYTATLSKRARGGRIFIDYLRNGRGATAIGAFSTRARAHATVSVPLSWKEVESGVRSDQFTIRDLPQRLADLRSDPWEGFFALKQSVSAAARRALHL